MYSEESEVASIYHAMLSKTQTVKDLYTSRGICKGCGECCSRFLPMSEFDMQRLCSYVRKHHIKPQKRVARGINLMCPYLTDAKECAVYHARPEVCRTYRCDKQVRGELLDFYGCGSAEVCDMYAVAGVLEMSNDDLRKLADKLEEHAED